MLFREPERSRVFTHAGGGQLKNAIFGFRKWVRFLLKTALKYRGFFIVQRRLATSWANTQDRAGGRLLSEKRDFHTLALVAVTQPACREIGACSGIWATLPDRAADDE